MRTIDLSAKKLVSRLLVLSETHEVCLLDSCGVGHLGSHLLIAGVNPVDSIEISNDDPQATLTLLEKTLGEELAAIFTLSYELGSKLQRVAHAVSIEPDLFVARFEAVVVHDYSDGHTFIAGLPQAVVDVHRLLSNTTGRDRSEQRVPVRIYSDLTRDEYIARVEQIREHIRGGDTYQTNLTQQLKCELPEGLTSQAIFEHLRTDHPAPFAAFIRRPGSTVISASPERFFRIGHSREIETSPIKGTRPRGTTPAEDDAFRKELVSSEKDRAENTMIVDLLRNDIGRVCEFGSVEVKALCELEEHPSLFHLVSTVRGKLRETATFSDVLRAVFPCGSITGAPKKRTMQIIAELEPNARRLSMGAIGRYLPQRFGQFESFFDVNVAIRTMVIRNGTATFNVGGGVVIDSDPEKEYEESLLKAKALMNALGARFE